MKNLIIILILNLVCMFSPFAGENDVKYNLALAYKCDWWPNFAQDDFQWPSNMIYYNTNAHKSLIFTNGYYCVTNKPMEKYPVNEYPPIFVMQCQYTGTATNRYRLAVMEYHNTPNYGIHNQVKSGIEGFAYVRCVGGIEAIAETTWVAVNTFVELIPTNVNIRMHSNSQYLRSGGAGYKAGIYKVIVTLEE